MRPFIHLRAKSPAEADALAAQVNGSRFIAGGTNLLDLMKLTTPPRSRPRPPKSKRSCSMKSAPSST